MVNLLAGPIKLRLDVVSRVVILLAGPVQWRLKRVSGVVNLLAGPVQWRLKRVSRGASLLAEPVKLRLKRVLGPAVGPATAELFLAILGGDHARVKRKMDSRLAALAVAGSIFVSEESCKSGGSLISENRPGGTQEFE